MLWVSSNSASKNFDFKLKLACKEELLSCLNLGALSSQWLLLAKIERITLGDYYRHYRYLNALEVLENVEYLSITPEDRADFASLASLKKLKDLRIEYSTGGCATFPDLPSVESFSMDYGYINSFCYASKLKNLKSLSFFATTVTRAEDAAFEIGSLKSLESLRISEETAREWGKFLNDLGPMENLQRLSLQSRYLSTPVDFSHFPNLKQLWLSLQVTADLSGMKGLARLEELEIYQLSEALITTLPQLPALTLLKIESPRPAEDPITDFNIKPGTLPSLKQLSLKGNRLTSKGTKNIAQLATLTHLDLADNDLDSLRLMPILGMKLTRLWVGDNRLRDLDFLQGMTTLEDLDLRRNPLGDLSSLLKLSQLQWLDLMDCSLAAGDRDLIKKSLPNTEIRF